MLKKLSEKIVLNEISNGRIDNEQKEEYIYGINMFLDVLLNILSMIIIGIITHKLWECIVFCSAYKFMRKYTGGFHFESAFLCYISSCATYFAVIGIITYIPFKTCGVSMIVAVSMIIIWIMSPIEAIHKPLDDKEKQVFKKRARINAIIILFAYGSSLFIKEELTYVIGISIISVMFFVIIGKIKLMLYTESELE